MTKQIKQTLLGKCKCKLLLPYCKEKRCSNKTQQGFCCYQGQCEYQAYPKLGDD